MKWRLRYSFYIFIPLIVIVLDRITKQLVVTGAAVYHPFSFLTVAPVFNRGISWGLLNSMQGSFVDGLIIAMIMAVIGALIIYTYNRARHHQGIFAELLVVSGAISNVIDRFFWPGVIDFIELRYHDWIFPSFNLADISITLGIGIMLYHYTREFFTA
jgi:signal peptidase II